MMGGVSTRSSASSASAPEVYQYHSSRSPRIVPVLSGPHRPRPDPASGESGCWRSATVGSSMGTITATGRACRVISVERPFYAAACS